MNEASCRAGPPVPEPGAEHRPDSTRRRDSRSCGLVLAGLAVCFVGALLPGSLRKSLWDPDATRYGQVAREMVESGDWIVPHFGGRLYTHKPPLYFWAAIAASAYAGDITPFGARIPAILSGVLAILATFWFARRTFGEKAALASAAVLASCAWFFKGAQEVRMDVMLTFWSTLGMALFFFGFQDPRRRWAYYAGCGLALGMATLTKGPVGFVPQFLVMTAWALLRGRRRDLFCKESVLGLGFFLVLVLAWLVPLCLRPGVGPKYLHDLFVVHISLRFFKEGMHTKPFHFFLVQLPMVFFPWVVFLPSGLVYATRKLKATDSDAMSFVLVWAGLTFLFFTLSRSKSETYILPMLPALACVVGVYWQGLFAGDAELKRWLRGTIPLAVLFLMYFGTWLAVPSFVKRTGRAAFLMRHILLEVPGHVLLFGGTLAALELFRRKRKALSFACLVLMMFGLAGYALASVSRIEDERRSHRAFFAAVNERMEPGAEVAAFHYSEASLYYYGGFMQAEQIAIPRIARALEEGRDMYVLVRLQHLKRMMPLLNAKPPGRLHVLLREGPYKGSLLLLGTPGLRARWPRGYAGPVLKE